MKKKKTSDKHLNKTKREDFVLSSSILHDAHGLKSKKIIAVIPAFNEATRIAPVVRGTKAYVNEVIVVDDHSKDDTLLVAKSAGANAVRLISNTGAGMATRVGCDIAIKRGAEIIVTIDADGQHSPDDIPRLVIELIDSGCDIVFGSRPRNKNMPLVKRVGNLGLSTIASMLFGIDIKDSQTGFHVFTADAYKKLRWDSNRYGVVSEFVAKVAKNRLTYREVYVRTIYNDKTQGMRKRDAVKSVISMIKWRLRE